MLLWLTATAPRTAVLCPSRTHIEPACARGLREIEAAGVEVRRCPAPAAVDRARGDVQRAPQAGHKIVVDTTLHGVGGVLPPRSASNDREEPTSGSGKPSPR